MKLEIMNFFLLFKKPLSRQILHNYYVTVPGDEYTAVNRLDKVLALII